MWDEPLVLGIRSFRSRLILGAERYPSAEILRRSHEVAGVELVSLAVRDLDLAGSGGSLLASIDQARFTLIGSTTGCKTADEAVRTAYLGREAGLGDFVKVDVIGDERTEMPDLVAVAEATRTLARDGFVALAVAGEDPVTARRMVEAGAAGILIQPAPTGSGLGIRNPYAVRLVLDTATVPVIVAGGIGTASDAALAMELGCHAVMVGTAVAEARDPEVMAEAMRHAVEAGRGAYKAGRIARRLHRNAFGSPGVRTAQGRHPPHPLTRPDVVVVGAGAIGAACAYELARAGLRVLVVERAEPGAEASGASAGILSVPRPSRRDPIATLGRLSREFYEPLAEALLEEAGIDVGLGRTGHLHLCMTEGEADHARRVARDPQERADGISFLAADALRRLEPAVSPAALGALHLPRSSWVDNVRLVRALVRAGERRGVRYASGAPAEALVRAGERVTGVRVGALGTIDAGLVVLAAGAWSGAIGGAPATLAVRPVKGQILAFANEPAVVRHVLFRDDVYLVPRLSGECLFGATVEDGVSDRDVTLEGLSWLLQEALRTAPGLGDRRFLRAWAGLRPASEDGLPIVGPWPEAPGLLVATGHYRNGILLTPVTARIIRDYAVDGRSSLEAAAALLPDRLARR